MNVNSIPNLKAFKERFWSKVIKGPECWEWQAGTTTKGYGSVSVNGVAQLAHRVSFMLKHGSLQKGKCLLHKCDNRRCVNPSHLRKGTRAENSRDMKLKGRARWGGNPGRPKGEINGNCVLTRTKVLAMREAHEGGDLTYVDLGTMFGCTPENASLVIRRKTWKHI